MDAIRESILPEPVPTQVSAEVIGHRILEEGIAVWDGVLPISVLEGLREDALRELEEGNYRPARVGKGVRRRRMTEVRTDRIRWLERSTATDAQIAYWTMIDHLRTGLSSFFRVHLERMEAHFAVYPEGAFYARHYDQFRGVGNRIFSVILYLNPEWEPGHGGELRVHPPEGAPVDYAPLHGRLIVFRSDEVLHEVLVSQRQRVSVTGWMRRDAPIVL
ncbi:MAG: 2OG-Fe(II) oxygenase [Candidatus Eisenbacteria bacterium]